jgi:ribonuclease HI
MKHVDLIADGSCLSHRGPGGWACILRYKGHERILTGGALVTTNNQMELRAITMGLRVLQQPCDVSVFTDSKYVEEGMNTFLPQRRLNKWRNSRGRPLPNQKLWLQLASAAIHHRIHWFWVKGHAANEDHNRCDRLARETARKITAVAA